MLDSVLLSSGIPFDTQKSTKRNYEVLESVLDTHLRATESRAQRKIKEPIAAE